MALSKYLPCSFLTKSAIKGRWSTHDLSFMNSCSHLFLPVKLRNLFPKILQGIVSIKFFLAGLLNTYHSGMVNKHTNKNSDPKMENTSKSLCFALQSSTK